MANTKVLHYSFGGGEISPLVYGRVDDSKYQAGVAQAENFIVSPQGPLENRAGTEFVREVKYPDKATRLIPFNFSNTNTLVIEIGHYYFRFHTDGETVLNPDGTPYEVASPYPESDVFQVHYVQSADVMTLAHQAHPPATLSRYGTLDWRFSTIVFGASIAIPGAPTVTTKGNVDLDGNTDTSIDYYYVVTAVQSDLITETAQSDYGMVSSNLFITGCTNTIEWTAVPGAAYYNVYKIQGGLYGFIGQTSDLSIVDTDIAPDLSTTPPNYDNVFSGPGDYPGTVSYYQQRKVFGGTLNQPENIWMTKSGTEAIMSYSLPVRADDRIAFRIAARDSNAIVHVVPLTQLLMMTSAAEWQITSINSDAITPTTISVAPQAHVGASYVIPQTVNNNLVYAAARGGHVRELAYNWQASGFVTGDLCLRSSHLFDNETIVDMAFSKAPKQIVWCVSSSGKLLGLTYIPEQQVGAWHQHTTINGSFESCAVVPENSEDYLYVIVSRNINGVQTKFVERMATRMFANAEDAFFVDSGATYSGSPVSTISGLTWLEGEIVSILGDGAVMPQQRVENGTVTLPYEASVITVGLPITAVAKTLPFSQQVDAALGAGRMKNVNKAWLRVYRSSGIKVGPDENNLTEYKQRTIENPGSAPMLITDEIHLVISPSWNNSGQVTLVHDDPLPLTLTSMTLEVSLGG